jgi:hypothetical protein
MRMLLQNRTELPMKSCDTANSNEESINETLRLKMLESRRIQQVNILKRMMHTNRHQSA